MATFLAILIQLVVLIVAMVIAGLIIRWIIANPEKLKSKWKRIKRSFVAPRIWVKSYRAYRNWKKVKMGFSYKECRDRLWQEYDDKNTPEKPYYHR
ncbi:MAG: hypothetical protein HN929_07640 [Chloroflexi bacterium]|mgnify:CR=1 FL=1|jgi:hypothetical protein|nr:hypothetical protein [Chloroflexota bacterium]MBT7081321.1 hypothetical protein [Chloroflexota bacterium]MBT7290489.1 hypothetical protein [Chloroflexota bacterium]